MRSRKNFLTLGIIVLVLFLGVGYAVVSSVYLNIGGTANVASSDLNVEITNAVATTSIVDKTVDFSHTLSNKNLNSNFTLKGMELNEVVSITYTVTNNETDVDAELTLAKGVILNNFNPDFFEVDYEITDGVTDLENDDKTMEVVVTVELIRTPITEDESSTTVSLYLSASPKGTSDNSSSTSTDVLDNLWPVAWNSLEILNNTLLEEEILRVSNLAPSLNELQSSKLIVSDGEEEYTLLFDDYVEEWPVTGALYTDGNTNGFVVYSIAVAIEEEDFSVEPGLYVLNLNENQASMNLDFRFEPNNNYVRFGEKYYITTFLKQDARKLDDWVIFNEDGTATQGEYGINLPTEGYTYSKTNIHNTVDGDELVFNVSPNGKYLTIGDLSTIGAGMFVIESRYNELSSIPLQFGLKYVCTTDNVNGGRNLGEYIIGYADGSGTIGSVNGKIINIPYGDIHYSSTYLESSYLPSGTRIEVSSDGNTLSVVDINTGEVFYIYTSHLESGLPIDYIPADIVNNLSVNVDKSYVGGTSGETFKFIKFSETIINYGFMRNSEAQIEAREYNVILVNSSVVKDGDAYILKYVNDTYEFYVLVIPTAGDYFGTTFTESGIYGSDTIGDTYMQIDFTY